MFLIFKLENRVVIAMPRKIASKAYSTKRIAIGQLKDMQRTSTATALSKAIKTFDNQEMAIVNLSIPQDLKDEFEKVFRGRNKSALIVELMREAIACERRHGAHVEAIDDIVMTRGTPPFDDDISISHSRSQVPR